MTDMKTLTQTLQAAIDLAWDYTDDPDECQALSDANLAIEELEKMVAQAKVIMALREQLLEIEADTGHLDAEQMHGTEDDAAEIVDWLAAQ